MGGGAVSAAGLVVFSLPAYPPIRLSAQSRFWRPEDRALISDFSYVTAVAASPFTVFGATTHGLVVYDRQARTWRLPVTTLDGRSEEHTSELQSRLHLVCRLLLEKKNWTCSDLSVNTRGAQAREHPNTL